MPGINPQYLTYTSGGYDLRAFAAVPPQGGPGIIVLHAWWGLTSFFEGLCVRLAEQGFVALAPDLYGGVTANTVEQAQQALDNNDFERSRAAASAALEKIRGLPGVQPGRVGVIGFSMGAAWAVTLSAEFPQDIAAAVLFYGVDMVDFSQAQAAYQGHFSPTDEWEPVEGIRLMERSMQAAGREVEFFFYPGTGHWFFEDNHPEAYQAEAAKQAWERTITFFKTRLEKPGK
jgi:carboxymethylenebutenolidase